MADAAAAGNVKTVSVSVSNDELRKLSRTRRRRQTTAALRADLTMVDNGVQEPVSNTNAIHIIKNQEVNNLAEGERKMLGNSEKPKESTIHIGLKKEATATAAAPAVAVVGTTAPVVSTAASAAKVTPHINPTKAPRILYTKKQPRAVAAVAKSKPAVVIRAGTTVAAATVAGTTVAAIAPPKKSFFGSKARTRKFKERKVSISLKRRPSNRKAIAQVATMPLTDVRAKLMAAGLLSKTSNAKKTQPPAVLRGMLTEWIQLHSGTV